MKVSINSPLINEGFAVKSKAGLQLVVDFKEKNVLLEAFAHDPDHSTLYYANVDDAYGDPYHEITFTAESDEERELIKDTLMFELTGKYQRTLLFVKYDDLEELK